MTSASVTSEHSVFLEGAPVLLTPLLWVTGIACWCYVGLQLESSPRSSTFVSAAQTHRASLAESAVAAPPSPVQASLRTQPAIDTPLATPDGDDDKIAPDIVVDVGEDCGPAVQFAFSPGSNEPDTIPLAHLREFLDVAARHPGRKLIVEGYASQDGHPGLNLRLSHDRATTVGRVLERRGIPSERIVLQAFGEYRPSIHGLDERRATARIDGFPPCEGAPTP